MIPRFRTAQTLSILFVLTGPRAYSPMVWLIVS